MNRGLAMACTVIFVWACGADSRPPAPVDAQPVALAWVGPAVGPDSVKVMAKSPYGSDRTAIGDGRKLFNRFNCSGCHGDHGGGGMGPSLRDSLWYYGGTDAQVFASIYQGRDKGMPAWGTRLSADQVWKLTSYIKSMRTLSEPDPPH